MTRTLPETVEIGTLKTKNNRVIEARFPIENEKGLCVLCTKENRKRLLNFFQFFILELTKQTPKELLRFRLFDPQGMGGNLSLLTTIDKEIRGERIYNRQEDIEIILTELDDLLEENIQNVLGYQYETISEYNSKTRDIPLQYNFLVMVDFPKYLEKKHLEKLNRLVYNGRKAGIYLLLFIDTSFQQDEYGGIAPNVFINKLPVLFEADNTFQIKNFSLEEHFNKNFRFDLHSFDSESKDEIINGIVNKRGKQRIISVSLSEYLTDEHFWTESTEKGIKIPLGKKTNGITNLIFENNSFHALVGGKTGSGKTVLLHNIITIGAWLYSPKELQFCLLDYKEGTEFNIYKKLPHVKVLSVKSEIEFGLSFLDFVQSEIKKRGELFKDANVSNISTYRKTTGNDLPRLLIIIDEFQVLFGDNYSNNEFVASKLDDILKRGRSFGIHLILSSQSLAEIQMKSSSFGQLNTRIALSMNKEDSRRILDDNNLVPSDFTKPGQCVLNNKNGQKEGNEVFQAAYFSVEKLKQVISDLQKRYIESPDYVQHEQFIYDGSSEALLANNPIINNHGSLLPTEYEIFIGEPVRLESYHTNYKLGKETGSNTLIIGKDSTSALSIFYHSIFQLQKYEQIKIKLFVPPSVTENELRYFNQLNENSNNIQIIKENEITDLMSHYKNKIDAVIDGIENSVNYIFIYDIYNFRAFRKSGYNQPVESENLQSILRDGPLYGIHVVLFSSIYKGFSETIDDLNYKGDFDVKIQLNGGESERMMDYNFKTPTIKNGFGMIKSSRLNNEPYKFKTYSLPNL
ncbi:FtsK/SpoIIIE domain-containing protein [Maribellus maritimus]|uniref:FtsK/SpoIIIE domain-containing protein n=1 Tax=Maribellus maritimus TaxID=2870838 RepID=UPI001EEA69FA|nr:FtsK/SpoIIIE domain-containing protein [Maribellus maritimus]MCG6191403.1 hypothetical protein [Maribellus maritimus]